MRTSIALTAALAAGAVASPLGGLGRLFKRDYYYDYSYVTTTIYVEADAEPTAAPAYTSQAWHWHGHKGHHTKTGQAPAPAAPTYTAPQEEQPDNSGDSQPAPAYTTEQQPPAQAAPTQAAAQPNNAPSTGNSYSDQVIRHHNVHRTNHSAPDVKWSQDLADTANKIAQSCVYAHDTATDGGGYGQNIAAGAPPEDIGSVISDLFYNGEVGYYAPYYGQATPNMDAFESFGHFTQVVWKDTTEVGCATVDCSHGGLANTGSNVPAYFTVCNYKGPGNYLGEFDKNVARPLGYQTADKFY